MGTRAMPGPPSGRLKPGYSSLLACRELAKKYKVTGHPTLLIIDKQGKIADVHTEHSGNLATVCPSSRSAARTAGSVSLGLRFT